MKGLESDEVPFLIVIQDDFGFVSNAFRHKTSIEDYE